MLFIIRLIVVPIMLLSLSAACTVLCLFRPFHQKNTRYYTRFICPIMLWLLGVKTEVENSELIPRGEGEPAILMSNHQHNIDGLVVSRVFHWTHTIVGKKSIKYVPFFGWLYWLCGMILIDRNRRRSAHETMNKVEQYLRENKFSLYLFPEGTRSKGKGLKSFKKGGFRTAINLQRDIIPVIISPYFHELDLNKWVSVKIKIKVLPRIPSKGYTLDNIDELVSKVHKEFETGLDSLK